VPLALINSVEERMMNTSINRDFRPATYFRPQKLEAFLLTRVKGAVMRDRLKMLFEQGLHKEASRLVIETAGAQEELKTLEAIHPMFMGGNYLPNMDEGEVEIARISIQSTTYDVTCVYASMDEGMIHYKVVDEYGGETLNSPATTESLQPLTLGELCDFLFTAWPFLDVLEMNFEDDLDGALGFFTADSNFYSGFSELCSALVIDHYADGDFESE
jgi:hypothetical protein